MKIFYVLGLLVIVSGIVFVGTYTHVKREQQAYVGTLEAKIASSRDTLQELSVLTDRNAPDKMVENALKDCSGRGDYEALLSRLEFLNAAELDQISNLHNACGNHFAVRKSFMAARMSEELSFMKTLIEIYGATKAGEHDYTELEQTWQEIVDLETQKGTLLVDQARLQGEVIKALSDGSSLESEAITSILSRAQDVAQLLDVADTRVDAAREREKSIDPSEDSAA